MPSRRPLTDSPFDTLERTFNLLVTGPRPLALDGTTVGGLPNRMVPLGELKTMLLHPATPFAVRDASVGALVARSQANGQRWTVGVAGVLLPGLRRAVWPLVRATPGRAGDIEAETLTALLTAVAGCSPGRERIAAHLCWKARKGASRAVRSELAELATVGADPVSPTPPGPGGHPDLVLARAVAAGVISAADSELIGATRLEKIDLKELAESVGVPYGTLQKRRSRAETVLTSWIRSDQFSSEGMSESEW